MVNLKYNDSTHTYYTEIGGRRRVYISATTLIGKYKEKFDPMAASIAYAFKNGNTPEYWRAQWALKGMQARHHGTAEHLKKENNDYVRGGFATEGLNLINYHALADGVYPELKLWHHIWHIAGRADKCIIETLDSGRYMDIDDYKTNKELKDRGYQFRDGSRKMMLGPVSHLEDCTMNHYTLQLSLYQYMAEFLGFKPGDRRIIHIPGDGSETIYELPYLRSEIQAILQDAAKNKYISL